VSVRHPATGSLSQRSLRFSWAHRIVIVVVALCGLAELGSLVAPWPDWLHLLLLVTISPLAFRHSSVAGG
jgi:hypothetical protein